MDGSENCKFEIKYLRIKAIVDVVSAQAGKCMPGTPIWLSQLKTNVKVGCSLKPWSVEGACGATPRRVSRDCSGTVCDGALKLGITDASFKPDNMNFFSFLCQASSLTMTS